MANILITADDYGLDPAINQGIQLLAEAGAIDAVSIMVHPGADLSTLPQLVSTGIPLGLHLVLVEENPLRPDAFPSGQSCLPKNYRALFAKIFRNHAYGQALIEEAAAQVERACALRIPLQFINSHQHVHLFPPLWRLLRDLFESTGLTVRASSGCAWTHPKQLLVDAASSLSIARWPLRHCDRIRPIGIGSAGHLDRESLPGLSRLSRKLLLQGINTELVVHPGHRSPELDARYTHWHYQWDEELALLLSGDVRTALAVG